jgi:hypothetical protein
MSKQHKGVSLRKAASFKARYGGNPAHLLLLVAAAALAGFAVLHWLHAPTPVRLLVWFAASVIAHDLIAFPIYAGLDRLLVRAVGGSGQAISKWRRAAINHVRFPVAVSILLLIMWYPLILKRSDAIYYRASGDHQDRYLGNWLLAVAILFGASLVIFAVRLALAAGRSRSGGSPPKTASGESSQAPPGPETNPR